MKTEEQQLVKRSVIPAPVKDVTPWPTDLATAAEFDAVLPEILMEMEKHDEHYYSDPALIPFLFPYTFEAVKGTDGDVNEPSESWEENQANIEPDIDATEPVGLELSCNLPQRTTELQNPGMIMSVVHGEPDVHVVRSMAIVTWPFKMNLSRNLVDKKLRGEDLLLCKRSRGRWSLAWRRTVNVIEA